MTPDPQFRESDHPRGTAGRFSAKPAPARDQSAAAGLRAAASPAGGRIPGSGSRQATRTGAEGLRFRSDGWSGTWYSNRTPAGDVVRIVPCRGGYWLVQRFTWPSWDNESHEVTDKAPGRNAGTFAEALAMWPSCDPAPSVARSAAGAGPPPAAVEEAARRVAAEIADLASSRGVAVGSFAEAHDLADANEIADGRLAEVLGGRDSVGTWAEWVGAVDAVAARADEMIRSAGGAGAS